jgi:hypothetical protein
MTGWRKRIESISEPAGAEIDGNSAKANRGEYDGAFISTQLTGWQREKTTRPPLTLIWRGQRFTIWQCRFGSGEDGQIRKGRRRTGHYR